MTPHLLDSLGVLADFLTWQGRFAGVEGFLHDLEGYILMQLAAKGGGIGAIVEIGSFMGRSTAFLAAGSKMAGREHVFAVDHFRGSIEHQAGGAFANPTLVKTGTTFDRFQQNLQRLGLNDYVTPIQNSSVQAAERWTGPIRLLFIDGDHAYESVRQAHEANFSLRKLKCALGPILWDCRRRLWSGMVFAGWISRLRRVRLNSGREFAACAICGAFFWPGPE